jgi:hypothetical protein
MGRQIGYARVSTDGLHGKAQKAALQAVPCDLIFFEQESGANRERPELAKTLRALRPATPLGDAGRYGRHPRTMNRAKTGEYLDQSNTDIAIVIPAAYKWWKAL